MFRRTFAFSLLTSTSSALRMMSSTSAASKLTLKVGVCQVAVTADKSFNIQTAKNALEEASDAGSQMVVLPECWNSPYSVACFPEYAEQVPSVGQIPDPLASPSFSMVCEMAKKKGVWVVGGSIPERDERDGRKLYNTCLVVNPAGEVVGKHRKVHLFDIDIPGKISFKESDSLSCGHTMTVVDTPWGGVGVGICYDMRFPEMALLMRQEKGCNILVYPGAFNMVTGPAHWELLQRARAVDNQVFVVTCSPARDTAPDAVYTAWGHSTIVNPWGEVVQKADSKAAIIYADLDLAEVDSIRSSIPCWAQKRSDLYSAHLKDNVLPKSKM